MEELTSKVLQWLKAVVGSIAGQKCSTGISRVKKELKEDL